MASGLSRYAAVVAGTLSLTVGANARSEDQKAVSSPDKVAAAGSAEQRTQLDVRTFRRVKSGKGIGYFKIVNDPADGTFLHGSFRSGMKTVTLATQVPESLRTSARRLRWRWRVLAFPEKGDECRSGFTDSAAVVYVTFKSGMAWRALKYVWSTVGPLGKTCGSKKSYFVSQDTIVLESGGPTGVWRKEEIDLHAEYREHFEGGNPKASVPAFVGVAVLTDGDQTRSTAIADFADFEVIH
jgi:hypothetical protein